MREVRLTSHYDYKSAAAKEWHYLGPILAPVVILASFMFVYTIVPSCRTFGEWCFAVFGVLLLWGAAWMFLELSEPWSLDLDYARRTYKLRRGFYFSVREISGTFSDISHLYIVKQSHGYMQYALYFKLDTYRTACVIETFPNHTVAAERRLDLIRAFFGREEPGTETFLDGVAYLAGAR